MSSRDVHSDDEPSVKRMRVSESTDSTTSTHLPSSSQTSRQDDISARAVSAAVSAGEWTTDARATATSLKDATSAYIDTRQDTQVQTCPYLDTVNRAVLDFDFEKVCSVTLQPHNLYCCLVCGKFFQGRGRSSPAYEHSLDPGHAVFIHMHTGRFYCLPDNYEVIDISLNDIKHYLSPTFTPTLIRKLATDPNFTGVTSVGSHYIPGFIGVSDLGATGWVSTTLRALLSIGPLRALLLQPHLYAHATHPVLIALGEFSRRLWWPNLLRAQISPHELVQACSVESAGRFTIGKSADAGAFLIWLLHTISRALTPPKPVTTTTPATATGAAKAPAASASAAVSRGQPKRSAAAASTVSVSPAAAADIAAALQSVQSVVLARSAEGEGETRLPATVLTLNLPPMPVFARTHGTFNPHVVGAAARATSALPQVSIKKLLAKFDGHTISPPPAAAKTATATAAATVTAKPTPSTTATATSAPTPVPATTTPASSTPASATTASAGKPPALPSTHTRTMSLASLPQYLLLHTPRRTTGEFGEEWNRTLVNAPIKGLDMSPYWSQDPANGHSIVRVSAGAEMDDGEDKKSNCAATAGGVTNGDGLGTEESRSDMSVSELKQVLGKCCWQWNVWEQERQRSVAQGVIKSEHGVKSEVEGEDFTSIVRRAETCVEKQELQTEVTKLVKLVRERRHARCVYDLVCQVCEEREPREDKIDIHARYYSFVLHEPTGRWYRLEDLQVQHDETTAQQLALCPALVKVYKRRSD